MIQQKPATDQALIERARKAVQNGDETMKPVLEWDRRGRKPKDYGTEWHHKAKALITELEKDYKVKDIAKHLDTYPGLLYRIKNGEHSRVPLRHAKRIAQASKDVTPEPTEGVSWDEYRRAQQILKDDYKTMGYPEIAEKYNLPYRRVYNMIKDQYQTPNPVARVVLESALNDCKS